MTQSSLLRERKCAHSRERSHGDLHFACEFHRPGDPQDQGFTEAGGRLQRHGEKCGATVKDVFWTLGEYDIVAIVEAPDDMSITALGLSSGALGNIRTQTLRAFAQEDMKTILGKMVKS
jgi:uncharacterized protein with GYD domain